MAGWDASAKVLGIVRYRTAGDIEAAVQALVRGGIGAVEVDGDLPDRVVLPDDRLAEDGCVLETEIGVVDASIQTQLRAIEKALINSLK